LNTDPDSSPSNLPLSSDYRKFLDLFLSHCAGRQLSPTGTKHRKLVWIAFSAWCVEAGLSPGQVSKLLVYTWIESLRISQNTSNNYILTIRQIYRLAFEEGLILKSPLLNIKPPRKTKKNVDVLSAEEIGRIESGLRNARPSRRAFRDRILFELALLSLRTDEIRTLKWSCVKGDTLTVIVKGRKLRKFPIGDELRFAFSEYAKLQGEASCYVFRNQKSALDAAPDESSIRWFFKGLLKRGGVIRLSYAGPHLWRHSVATILYRKTNNLKTVRDYLGHVYLSTTQGYIHLSDEDMMESLKEIKEVVEDERQKNFGDGVEDHA